MENSVVIIPLIETKGDALGDLGPFLQFKKREKHSWKMVTFSKVEGFSLQFTKSNTPPVVFFTIFKSVQMVPNRAKHHKCIEKNVGQFSFMETS